VVRYFSAMKKELSPKQVVVRENVNAGEPKLRISNIQIEVQLMG